MLRCTREELRDLHPSALSPPLQPDGQPSFEKADQMIAEAVLKGSHRFEWIHRSPHREDFPVEVLLTPIELGGRPMVLTVWRDITERVRTEAALRQSQRLESLGVLAGGIAHDFNNLLAAIGGHIGLARASLGTPEEASQHLHHAQVAVEKAASLTRQLLAYGGMGVVAVQPLDLGLAVREMAELLAVSVPKGIELRCVLPDDLPPVPGDEAQLQQIVMNLVTNAAEAIGDRAGTILVQARVARLDRAALDRDYPGQALPPGNYVILEVTDDGQGMAPEVEARIFDPFFTTKEAGRGLGLSALRGIVKAHGGGIQVRTQAGRGTTFAVALPAREGVAVKPPPRPEPSPARARASRGTVLLVDDEALVRRSSRMMLERLGFEVLEASDGDAAVAVHAEHGDRIDWVLMDLTMPRLDGHASFVALRRTDPDVRVVICSGWAETELAQRFRADPPAAFLAKPFGLADIESALVRAGLGEGQAKG